MTPRALCGQPQSLGHRNVAEQAYLDEVGAFPEGRGFWDCPEHGGKTRGDDRYRATFWVAVEMLERDQERPPICQPGLLKLVDEDRKTVMVVFACELAGGRQAVLDGGLAASPSASTPTLAPGTPTST